MTNARYTKQKNSDYINRIHAIKNAFICCMLIFTAFSLSVFLSDEISSSVKEAILLCANVIIPSVFPFMVISDFLYRVLDFTSLNCIGNLFERIFKIRRSGMYAFSLGILCGFPLGVKCAADLYSSGKITRNEAERLIGFSNNTGPAFLVCGIGLGLRGNIKDGIVLYAVMVISAVICGLLFSVGEKTSAISNTKTDIYCRFSITESIRQAGLNTLNICSYLTFFSCICGLLHKFLGECRLYMAIIPFLEIGSAASILSKTSLLGSMESLALSSFAIGFSGFSVHLQALSFLSGTDIRTGKYFIMKLLQGLISVPLTCLAYLIFL